MTILKLTGFSCEAEVLGVPRKVTFAGATLCIAGLDLVDAYRVLEAVAIGSVVGVGLPVNGNPMEAVREQAAGPASSVEGSTMASPAQAPVEEPKKERKHKPYTKPIITTMQEGDDQVADQEPAQAVATVPEPAQQPEPEPLVLTPAKAPTKEERTAGMLADMKAAAKLRDIVLLLQENGVTAIEDMVATCEKVKADIPLLKAIPNLSDRIGRTIQYLGGA